MDELIFQEFKGTGNMELILDRKLSDRRLYPALDSPRSGTRKEEKLFPAKHLDGSLRYPVPSGGTDDADFDL